MSPRAHKDDRSIEAGPGWLVSRHTQSALVAFRDDGWVLDRLCEVEVYHSSIFPAAKATPDPEKHTRTWLSIFPTGGRQRASLAISKPMVTPWDSVIIPCPTSLWSAKYPNPISENFRIAGIRAEIWHQKPWKPLTCFKISTAESFPEYEQRRWPWDTHCWKGSQPRPQEETSAILSGPLGSVGPEHNECVSQGKMIGTEMKIAEVSHMPVFKSTADHLWHNTFMYFFPVQETFREDGRLILILAPKDTQI